MLAQVLDRVYDLPKPGKEKLALAAHEKAKKFSIEVFVNALDELADKNIRA
jgi:hypothetical protein